MKKNNKVNIEINDTSVNEDLIPDYKELYIKSLADYKNMKRFMDDQVINARQSCVCDFVNIVISSVYNDLLRGIKSGIDGCDLILKNLISYIKKFDVDVIGDEIIGTKFDTNSMEAITIIETKDLSKLNVVADVIEHGFKNIKTNKTFTFAKVVVYGNGTE